MTKLQLHTGFSPNHKRLDELTAATEEDYLVDNLFFPLYSAVAMTEWL